MKMAFSTRNLLKDIKFLKHISVQAKRAYKAAVLKEVEKPLVIEERKPAKLKKGQVRVDVYNCAVNANDVMLCDGDLQPKPKLPLIPGFELSGEVVEVESNVKTLRPGDRVIGIHKENMGGFAEQIVLPEQDTWRIEQGMGFEVAASLIDCYATAILGLQRWANLKQDDTVLVTAAAGGLGLAAVDLAANVYKSKVIGVCGTADKAQLVRDKGAWSALRYQESNVQETVKDVTEGRGVRICFDAVGGDVFNTAVRCVGFEGKVVVAGFASRKVPEIKTSLLLPKALSIVGVSLRKYAEEKPELYRSVCQDAIDLYGMGLISPHVSAQFPLSDVNEALTFLRERRSTGKVLIDVR